MEDALGLRGNTSRRPYSSFADELQDSLYDAARAARESLDVASGNEEKGALALYALAPFRLCCPERPSGSRFFTLLTGYSVSILLP